MKVRDLLLGVVAAVLIWLVVFAPIAVSQVPVESQRITIDLSVFPKEEQPQVQRLVDQINKALGEINLKLRH